MHTKHTRAFADHPDISGRVRFVVQFSIIADDAERAHAARYGSPELEKLLFGDAAFNAQEWAALFTEAGIARTFDDASVALDWARNMNKAVVGTKGYWKTASSFPGTEG